MIGTAARIGVRLVQVNTVNGHPVELVQWAHPGRVTLRQVVVHRNHVHTAARQCIEVNRQSSHQGFTFTGRHFRNFSAVQYHTTDELYIVMYHIPFDWSTGSVPFVFPESFVAFDDHEIFGRSQTMIVFRCGHAQASVLGQAAGGFFYQRKGFGQDIRQHLFLDGIRIFFQLFNTVEQGFFFINIYRVLDLFLCLLDLRSNFCGGSFNFLLKFSCLVPQSVVSKFLYGRFCCFYFLYNLFYFLQVSGIFIAQKTFQNFIYKTHIDYFRLLRFCSGSHLYILETLKIILKVQKAGSHMTYRLL